MTKSWVDKYRPESFSQIQGNNTALKKIRKWAKDWTQGDKPQLLVGPPGTGKTTTAYVVSDSMGYPLNQINTSEARRTEDLERIARSMRSTPVDSEYQLVLLDEVDSWHHSPDKTKLIEALRNPMNPIILTANEEYDVPGSIKRASTTHKYKLGVRSRRAKLREIAEKEGLDIDKQDLAKLGERPDLRSAINDLQNWSETDLPPSMDNRTWKEGEFSAIESLLSGDYTTWRKSTSPRDETFSDPGWLLLWLDENLKKEYRGLEAGVAYDILSRADTRVQQGWDSQARGVPYAFALMQMVDEVRLSSPYEGYIKLNFPSWVRSKEMTPERDTPEAALFREIKSGMAYRLAGSFFEFRRLYLPHLQDLPEEKRLQLALDEGLSSEAIKALNLDPKDFEEWRDIEPAEEGEGWSPDTNSGADTNW